MTALPRSPSRANSRSAVAKKSIRSVGLVVKRHLPQAIPIAQQLGRLIRSRGCTVLAEPEMAVRLHAESLSKREIAQRADLIIALGGDGTLLSIARFTGDREVPLLGINLGGLGFLTAYNVGEAKASVARAVKGDFEVDRRLTLEASIESSHPKVSRSEEKLRALNDVVINKRAQARMLELDVIAGGEPFCSYRADGLIVASPTGSTAYALSAGGPIVFPTLRALVLVPICPHTLSNRPVVLPDGMDIEVRVKASDHDATLSIDGQEAAALCSLDAVRIKKSRNIVALVRSDHSYFEIWRNKLRWG
jgi:NAD+ kinase